jgi:p-hydroxybenzoate 3-monooxygenase
MHDVQVLADALVAFYARGDRTLLDAYSAACLRRVWRAQDFSTYMTTLLHRLSDDPFEAAVQRSRLDYVVSSEAASRSLAENYAGLPRDWT